MNLRGKNWGKPEHQQDRNRIHTFYWGICFSKITESQFVCLVIIRITIKKELP
jgi:hypothetical protein